MTSSRHRHPSVHATRRTLSLWSALLMTTTLPAACASLPTARDLLPDMEAPAAETRPKAMTIHGDTRVDDYYWLRDDRREDPEVLAYLEAENRYQEAALAPTTALQELLFEEIKGRLKKDDQSVPVKLDSHWYYARYEADREYPIQCRRADTMASPEEIILDENVLAAPHDFYSVGTLNVSPDENILAWSEDIVSRRKYTIRFKDLTSGEIYADAVPDTSGGLAWAGDSRTIFYVKKDPTTLRPHQVWRHTLGEDPTSDVLAYEEEDEAFYVGVTRTKSKRYVVILLESTMVSEVRVLDAMDPTGTFTPVLPREEDHEYSVAHRGDHFYIRTNWEATNFRLLKAPVATAADKATWEEVIAHRDDVLLNDVEVFDRWLVVSERKDALRQIRVIPLGDEGAEHYVTFDEEIYVSYVDSNPQFDTDTLRLAYESPVTPSSVYDYDLRTRGKTLLKQDTVLGGFDPGDYRVKRLWAPARDGASIPISLVYPAGVTPDGTAPLYQYGYGSYGYSMDPWFSESRLSLLDRGVVVAVCHARGGSEMGRRWYEHGRMGHKANTFRDFIDTTEFLVGEGWAAADKVVAAGGSAGGLLMGAVMNMRPDLYAAIHAAVPFVDVLTTMLDETIPLTTNEYDEWGNPNEAEAYGIMKAYSPYDNVTAQDYPHLLITTGLHDSQVQYFEPAKWIARLRALKTDDRLMVMHTDMETGHTGQSGRFKRFKDTALAYAFILRVLGLDGP